MSRGASVLVGALLATAAVAEPSAEPAVERSLLFLALDAVPYETAVAARRPGPGGVARFEGFQGPVPLISTFPSSTSVAFGAILTDFGLELSPGYEARFFDWTKRRTVGGGPVSYFRIRFPWREFFDWNRKGPIRNALQSARPLRSSLGELSGALEEFAAGDDRAFFVYVAATDTAAHLLGPDSLLEVFERLDEMLEATHRKRATPFDTVLFSDHGIAGGEPLANVRAGVEAALAGAGLRVGQRLEVAGDVVLTPFGLVSSFEIYASTEDGRRAARASVAAPGVDLCAFREDEGWAVVGSGGEARFGLEPNGRETTWRYEPIRGDPLGLATGFATGDGAGRLTDSAVLAASLESAYPDPLHRIARAFEWVENPATVLCSLAPGRMYGARRTEWLARTAKGPLRWTHGALGREASLGFVMSDRVGWSPPAALRADDALGAFGGDRQGAERVRVSLASKGD